VVVEAFERVRLDGTEFDPITEGEVVAAVRESLALGRGGRIVTPNVDILRRARTDPAVRDYLDDADLIVADGMPLIWASRLGGTPLPERVAGSSLIWTLSAGLGRDNRSVFVIGGTPGTSAPAQRTGGGGRAEDGAARAARKLAENSPGLRIAGSLCPDYGFELCSDTYGEMVDVIARAEPDLVFVGLGFPKQEAVISRLRPTLPATWFMGCGAAVNFAAGDVTRAPRWMQRTGLEWAHRLGTEPRRLAGRYLRHDAPYALRLLAQARRR
jgi:N-acetylglucosaminyldiphosphoundecaprenol N-acetyl-beta-D-mannosaminyltransferase